MVGADRAFFQTDKAGQPFNELDEYVGGFQVDSVIGSRPSRWRRSVPRGLLPSRAGAKTRLLSPVTALPSPTRAPVFLVLSVLVLSLLEFRALDLIGGRNLPAEVEAAAGIVAGHPYWKAYQNRLLGPLAVEGITRLTGWPAAGVYLGVGGALWCAANAGAAFLLRRAPAGGWGYAAAYAGLFVA